MFRETLTKEWLDAKRQGQLWWLSLIASLLLLLACTTGWQSYQSYQSDAKEVAQQEQMRWLNQGEKGPHSAAHYGIYVIKPATPLVALDDGLQEYQGNVVRLEAHTRNDGMFRTVQDNLPMARFGSLTPAFVLQVLLPLLILLIGYPMFSAEREQGTLKQLLASGVEPLQLFMAKCCVLFAISATLLLPVIVYLLFIQFGQSDTAKLASRSAGFFMVYISYVALWSIITIAMSCLLKSARRSLIALLTIWALSTLLIPKLAMNYSTHVYPLDSSQAFQNRLKREVYTEHREMALERFKQSLLQEYAVSSTNELPFDFAGARLQFGEQYADAIFDRLFGERLEQLQSQTDSYFLASLLSPMIAVQSLSMAFSASDFHHHQHFLAQAEQHRRMMQRVLNHNQRDHAHKNKGHYVANLSLWQQIPKFEYQPSAFTDLAHHYQVNWFSLILWLIASLLLGTFAVRKLTKEPLR
ncbi:DUF3526 domain-containing protein [Pseudoalteromonas luteoviolacea]|uniref:ABC transporter permease n=1 Tax=Pseudoalteromonas luteoviolacea NCIMB 1942 TaxID=1365253 RepID=A0A166Y518_9GAMM|nr:DUF3526 domain-containing protein [Pseudoalteromonas luteoviolacea]KZN41453.1 hypothetical protein N482_03890 [Pseudoalteromonas luteoviolacea NCIMB 1942]